MYHTKSQFNAYSPPVGPPITSDRRALKSSKPKAKAKSIASKPKPAPKRKVSGKRPPPVEPVAPAGEEPSVSTSRPTKKAKKAKTKAKK